MEGDTLDEPVDCDSVRRSIRTRLAFGIASHVAGAAWAGQARGDRRWAVGDGLSRVREMEYQPHGLEPPGYAHVHCFTAWLVESSLAAAAQHRPPERVERGERQAPLEEAG